MVWNANRIAICQTRFRLYLHTNCSFCWNRLHFNRWKIYAKVSSNIHARTIIVRFFVMLIHWIFCARISVKCKYKKRTSHYGIYHLVTTSWNKSISKSVSKLWPRHELWVSISFISLISLHVNNDTLREPINLYSKIAKKKWAVLPKITSILVKVMHIPFWTRLYSRKLQIYSLRANQL
jgi:hypothetical protein